MDKPIGSSAMMSIQSILNPSPSSSSSSSPFEHGHQPGSSSIHTSGPPGPPSHKKQKMSKDGVISREGEIRGEIRYGPHETEDEEIIAQHRRLQIPPLDEIRRSCRHIPYNSEKTQFSEKTGRTAFDVFLYTFTPPEGVITYTVMWDYHVGLVRLTPFFKSCKHKKTDPSKMINFNPGLREICHSITGGAIIAQGYWLPFDAAKALAATFCYDVRYALTPLFGTDFISLCILPSDPDFARITIDSAIVKHSTEVANRLYDLSKTVSQACDQQTPSPYSLPKSASQKRRVGQVKTVAEENKFGTDKDCSDEDMDSPKTRFAEWTPLNAKQSAAPQKCDQSSPETKSTNRVLRSADSPKGLERKKSHRNKQISDSDQAEFPFQSSAETYDPLGQRIEPSGSIEDIQAAEILLLLSREDAALTNRRC